MMRVNKLKYRDDPCSNYSFQVKGKVDAHSTIMEALQSKDGSRFIVVIIVFL